MKKYSNVTTVPPYEEREKEERRFRVRAEHHLVKSQIPVETDDYDLDYDDDFVSVDSSETDFVSCYENSHYTPIELLKELENYIERELSVIDATVQTSHYRHLQRMLSDCRGWSCEETNVEEV